MENNIQVEIINNLAIKIANLEVQVAALTAENKALQVLQEQTKSEVIKEEANNESNQ